MHARLQVMGAEEAKTRVAIFVTGVVGGQCQNAEKLEVLEGVREEKGKEKSEEKTAAKDGRSLQARSSFYLFSFFQILVQAHSLICDVGRAGGGPYWMGPT